MTKPLDSLLKFFHALDWMGIKDKKQISVIQSFLDGSFGDPTAILARKAEIASEKEMAELFRPILKQARELIDQEHFMNWQVTFPGIWQDWQQPGLNGGFDAVIGNPPWDRMKLQKIEWFAERRESIAKTARASDREKMVKAIREQNDPLWHDYERAQLRADTALKQARAVGDYPLLSKGDINLYSLFVERAQQLTKPDGYFGLLVPSGIASDKNAADFFKGIATQGKLRALYDFENKKVFFPDVHASFKFCVFVASNAPQNKPARCAFFLHNTAELEDENRCFTMNAKDFALVNPNTGTAPIFRTRRDAELTRKIYSQVPILVDYSSGEAQKTWPVKYSRMFDMTNDSHLFRTQNELEEQEGAFPLGGQVYDSPKGQWLPLYTGRMIYHYDHRAASVTVNKNNLHNPAFSQLSTSTEKSSPDFLATPQFWILANEIKLSPDVRWVLGFRDITNGTNARTMIATICPRAGYSNKLPILKFDDPAYQKSAYLLGANLCSIVFDYVTRQKIQSTNLNWYIVEQLPVIPVQRYQQRLFGDKSAAQIIRQAVLELSYTAHNMADFARDLGYVDQQGSVLPPFVWDDERRMHLNAKLDALFFILYGITEREDVRYIYATFPILEKDDHAAFGSYLSCELCLSYMNALNAGKPDALIKL